MRHILGAVLAACITSGLALGADWPTYRGDVRRSGVSTESVRASHLTPDWTHVAEQAPSPAWPGPARWDAYAALKGLKSMRNYDPVFHPVIVGDDLYYASTADHAVHCVDMRTGRERWRTTLGGPIRVAPTVVDGRLYVGCDDGYASCLDARNGDLVWTFSPSAHERRLVNDNRVISFWPVRSGIVIDGETAYFAASLVPWRSSLLCALDARTGTPEGEGRFVRDLGVGLTLEGALVLSPTRLIAPQGRIAPLLFDRETGQSRGALSGGGGSFVLLTEDDHIVHGPGNKTGWLTDSAQETGATVAKYEKGNAIVVAEGRSYLLSDRSLGAIERDTGSLLWTVETDATLTMILVGDTIFLGGEDRVEAIDIDSGDVVWTGPAEGRVYGLAFANGTLVASTDEGRLHAYREGDVRMVIDDVRNENAPGLEGRPPAIHPNTIEGLLDRWVFQRDTVTPARGSSFGAASTKRIRNLARSLPASLLGQDDFIRAGDAEALFIDGERNDLSIAEDINLVDLPTDAVSAEAWVRVDAPKSWGGFVCAIQDNGSFERGWILGFRDRKFCMGVKSKGGDALTYLTGGPDFVDGAWHHVAGTYDGSLLRLYVDGELVAESDAQSGPIDYPPSTSYHVGAYRDDNEYYRLQGALAEVAVYSVALEPSQIEQQAARRRAEFPTEAAIVAVEDDSGADLAWGPMLRFETPTSAVLSWGTEAPSPSSVTLQLGEHERTLGDGRERREHEVTLTDLRPRRVYHYRMPVNVDGAPDATRAFECDTYFNYASGGTREEPHGLASNLLERSDLERGLCLVVGDRDLALELALASDLSVVLASNDVEADRDALQASGIYGRRLAAIPEDVIRTHPDDIYNLIVARTRTDLDLGRLLRPWGGIAFLEDDAPRIDPEDDPYRIGVLTIDGTTWTTMRRGAVPDAGSWTHMYGNADNSAFGGESLGGATRTEDLVVTWLGRPGPRYQSDRGNRKPAPLAVNGRLFLQGLNRVIALDSMNGTILWSWELPELQRFNMPRDCSNWCADDDFVYIAMGSHCRVFDAATGENVRTFEVARGPRDWNWEWGYLAREDDRLYASAVKAGSMFTDWWGPEMWYDGKSGPSTFKVCSDLLYASDARSGEVLWRHEGLVINSTITNAQDTLYFVENRNPAITGAESRRVGDDALWTDLHLVALDARNGDVLWEHPVEIMKGVVGYHLAWSDGRLVLAASNEGEFAVHAFDAKTGTPTWDRQFPWEADHHGKHTTRQAIVGGRVYMRPKVLDLESGEEIPISYPAGHQCGSYATTEHALFMRAGELAMWDLAEGSSTRWTRVRPDCWLSTIPANGMLLSPEGGGGCSCGSWMETSMGLTPIRASADE